MIVNNYNYGINKPVGLSEASKENISYGSLLQDARDTFVRNTGNDADILRDIPAPIAETAHNCATVSKNIKKHYDNLYGKGNWQYVSIGRSCSKIADCLEQLGVNSATIPISDLTNGVKNGSELCLKDGFDEYRNFIYGLGLNPKDVADSGKTYIFQDFCDSGKSLARFEEFIRSKDMALDLPNVIFKSINSTFDDIFSKKEIDFEDFKRMIDFNSSLANQSTIRSIKTYTDVKKLPPDQLKRIVNGIKDPCIQLNADFENALKHFLKNV